MVRLLVDKYKVDPKTPTSTDVSVLALIMHVEYFNHLILLYLQVGDQAIHIAALKGHVKLIQMLIDEYNVDPKAISVVRSQSEELVTIKS